MAETPLNCNDRRRILAGREKWRQAWQFVEIFYCIAAITIILVGAIMYSGNPAFPKWISALATGLTALTGFLVVNRVQFYINREDAAAVSVEGCPDIPAIVRGGRRLIWRSPLAYVVTSFLIISAVSFTYLIFQTNKVHFLQASNNDTRLNELMQYRATSRMELAAADSKLAQIQDELRRTEEARRNALGLFNSLNNASLSTICFQNDGFLGRSNRVPLPLSRESKDVWNLSRVSVGQATGGPGEANSYKILRILGERGDPSNDGK
jgi:hypothetical protein